ncbi:MAG: hypothetical protein O7G85_10330 [Planctomycetota bacterium]|nr:hypothetical protein [Planctomycetota bacterium]
MGILRIILLSLLFGVVINALVACLLMLSEGSSYQPTALSNPVFVYPYSPPSSTPIPPVFLRFVQVPKWGWPFDAFEPANLKGYTWTNVDWRRLNLMPSGPGFIINIFFFAIVTRCISLSRWRGHLSLPFANHTLLIRTSDLWTFGFIIGVVLLLGVVTGVQAVIQGTLFLTCTFIILRAIPALGRFQFRIDPELCASCQYNLTGNESGICPECGTEVRRA